MSEHDERSGTESEKEAEEEAGVREEPAETCHPRALRMCANMGVFTGVYSFSALVTSTLNAYVNGQVTTLERHFGFNSAQTGLIMAANDVGFLVVILFVSYVTSKVHIPRALGVVTILFGFSGILCAVPYFVYGAPSPAALDVISNVTGTASSSRFSGQMCDGINDTAANCDVTAKGAAGSRRQEGGEDAMGSARANAGGALVVIVIGMMLQGVAKTPRVPFTTTYVDANVDRSHTGFYMGIITALGIMGPALAYAVGGLFSRIYVTLEATHMHYRHPRWIGAWWLGYLTFGIAACLCAVPLLGFPRRFKRSRPIPGQDPAKSQALAKGQTAASRAIIEGVKGFVASMLRLWRNSVYMCVMMSSCAMLFAVAGSQSFTPKYIENQFSFPAWKANMAMAGMMLGTACLGTFVGGYMTRRFRMGAEASLKFTVVSQIVSTCCVALLMAFHCPQPHLYNSPGPRAAPFTSLPGCLGNCACDNTSFFPVCGDDGKSFFSPCHAGCQLATSGNMYRNCSCTAGGTATAGLCDYTCNMFVPFMLFMCLSALTSTFSIIPKLLLYIRVVEDRDKPLALGFNSFMTSITGWMLAPICFGKLIDDICIQWDTDSCTGNGACRLYDNDNFRFKLFGFQTVFRVAGVIFIVLAFILSKVNKTFAVKEDLKVEIKHVELQNVNGMREDKGLVKQAQDS